jgi:tetratricopeptide (TPR) repeat protein
MGFSALALVAECEGCDVCRVVGVGSLWGLASLAVGGSGGILFGIPRAYGQQEREPTPRQKTNLDEVSDWLTKLIIGGTLFQSKSILVYLGDAGTHFAQTISSGHTQLWGGVGSALLIYFGLVGFFGAYFPMRLYLAQAIDEADAGRSVVADRTGLPEDKLKALEAVPLNVETGRPQFDAATKGAATSIVSISFTSLVNWRDIRLWAKANLGMGNLDAAITAYQKALEIVEQDAESRLGYSVALRERGASGDLILAQLERARESLTLKSPGAVRDGVYKSLTYQCLYLQRPQSFLEALRYARDYFTLPETVGTASLWTNIACAYAQASAWLQEVPVNEIEDPNALYLNSRQPRLEGKRPLNWLRDQALAAVQKALSSDPARKPKLQGLMGEGPEKSDVDNDLVVFARDPQFRSAVGLT